MNGFLLRRGAYLLAATLFFTLGLCRPSLAVPRTPSPKETLRFFPDKPLALAHVNDLQATIDEIVKLVDRLGFGRQMRKGRALMWRDLKKQMQLSSPPKSWRDLFAALGLPKRPTGTVGLVNDPASKRNIGIVGVIPITSDKAFLRLLGTIAKASGGMAQARQCFYLCRSYLARMRINGVSGPVKIKPFLKQARRFQKLCPALITHFEKVGQVDCMPDPKDRQRFLANLARPPAPIKMAGGTAFLYPNLKIAVGLIKRFAVIASSQRVLRMAMLRYTKTRRHPLQGQFAKRNKGNTHAQMYFSQRGLLALQKLPNNQRTLRRVMPIFSRIEKILSNINQGYKSFWAEFHSSRSGFHMTSWMRFMRNPPPMTRAALEVKPSRLRSIRFLPQRTVFMLSTNYLGVYKKMAFYTMKKLGRSAGPIAALARPWLQHLGDEITFGVMPGRKALVQGVLALKVNKPGRLLSQIKRMQASLGGKRGSSLFKTKKIGSTEVNYIFVKRPSRRRRRGAFALPRSFEVAFAIKGKHMLITFQLINKPDLSLIASLINRKSMGPSLFKDKMFRRATRRSRKTSVVMYLSFPKIINIARMFVPPTPRFQKLLSRLSILHYLHMQGRNNARKRAASATGTLRISPK